MKNANTKDLARRLFNKHHDLMGHFDFYPGVVSLYGMARLAAESGSASLLKEITDAIMPYVRDERRFPLNFKNYYCGGVGTAYLLAKGLLPEAEGIVRHYAEEIMLDAPRDSEGILCHPQYPGEERIWIDVAFSVGPFLLFAGIALNDDRYCKEAFNQVAKMIKVLRNPENGLLHQCRGFLGKEFITEDHWARGNGWAAFTLSELVRSIPKTNELSQAAVELYLDLIEACSNYQDTNGLWHQEITEPVTSYAEISGTALILYSIGAGLEAGILPESYRAKFELGLQGLLDYITEDDDVFHTCYGCLCPGNGTKLDYMAHRPVLNDYHAFGPLILAFGQAHALGIHQITQIN